jgi:hypothetical protein
MGSSTNEPKSRRALLAGAAAGVAAVAAGRPQAAHAAAGQALVLGKVNQSNAETTIFAPALPPNHTTVVYFNLDEGAVLGGATLNDAYGVAGVATGANGIGVLGRTSGDATTIGVSGISDPVGIGVQGFTKNGTGVWAEATGGGHALHVEGRAIFATRSGRTSFSAGQAARVISNQFVGVGALVLATIQGNVAGIWVRGVSLDIPHNRFTILLNRTAPSALVVGWFIVN